MLIVFGLKMNLPHFISKCDVKRATPDKVSNEACGAIASDRYLLRGGPVGRTTSIGF